MTDNEIINSLRHRAFLCSRRGDVSQSKVLEQAADIIQNYTAEIERLERNLKFVRGTASRQLIEIETLSEQALYAKQAKTELRSEVVNEFATQCTKRITETIDNLVKEMVGE